MIKIEIQSPVKKLNHQNYHLICSHFFTIEERLLEYLANTLLLSWLQHTHTFTWTLLGRTYVEFTDSKLEEVFWL